MLKSDVFFYYSNQVVLIKEWFRWFGLEYTSRFLLWHNLNHQLDKSLNSYNHHDINVLHGDVLTYNRLLLLFQTRQKKYNRKKDFFFLANHRLSINTSSPLDALQGSVHIPSILQPNCIQLAGFSSLWHRETRCQQEAQRVNKEQVTNIPGMSREAQI